MAPTFLELFAGIGGLGLAVRRVWPAARCVGYVERDAYAASVLLARMADEALECAPVWVGDIRDLDGGSLPPRVDILTAGFPCQDISTAGKGAGLGGARSGLWSEVVRIAEIVEPELLILENVAAIRSARGGDVDAAASESVRALGVVLGDLAAIGYDAVWTGVRATEAGAPHQRRRWFCVAYLSGARCEKWRASDGQGLEERPAAERSGANRRLRRQPLPDAELNAVRLKSERGPGAARATERGDAEPRDVGEILADAGDGLVPPTIRRQVGRDGTGPAGEILPPWPPGPRDRAAWEWVLDRWPWLAPGISSAEAERLFRGVAHGLPDRVDAHRRDRIRCLGNAVVPAQAEIGIRWCLAQIVRARQSSA